MRKYRFEKVKRKNKKKNEQNINKSEKMIERESFQKSTSSKMISDRCW